METFNFPYHVMSHSFPKGDSFKFGGGYEFSAAPQLPLQRRFRLQFKSMAWFRDGAGVVVNSIEPELNMLALVEFYERHLTHKKFIYPHPIYGDIIVKFASDQPLEVPPAMPGGSGATEGFELMLTEQPL